jgi:hypothetical protein
LWEREREKERERESSKIISEKYCKGV